jgi:hypothetical protein
MDLGLGGKVAIVGASSRGLGKASAKRPIYRPSCWMHLSGHYSNPPEALEAALAALSEGVVRDRRRESAALVPCAAPRRAAPPRQRRAPGGGNQDSRVG